VLLGLQLSYWDHEIPLGSNGRNLIVLRHPTGQIRLVLLHIQPPFRFVISDLLVILRGPGKAGVCVVKEMCF